MRLVPRNVESPIGYLRDLYRFLESGEFGGRIYSYSTVGTRADTDFLLVHTAESIDTFNKFQAQINKMPISGLMHQAYSYLAMRRKTNYKHGGGRPPNIEGKYFILYPMVKNRTWYSLPLQERQKMMNEHFIIGHKYPNIRIHTTYSFGLDDPEFVVGFEVDYPEDFVALVMELRETQASSYTQSETPIFTTLKMSVKETLESAFGMMI